jgi:hypothetical protein
VYDADLNKEAEGCHGNLNRILCLSNEVVANRCQWNRKNSGVRAFYSNIMSCSSCLLTRPACFRASYATADALPEPSSSRKTHILLVTRQTAHMVHTSLSAVMTCRRQLRYAQMTTVSMMASFQAVCQGAMPPGRIGSFTLLSLASLASGKSIRVMLVYLSSLNAMWRRTQVPGKTR